MATDQLSTVFSALADPTRRDILARLGEGDANVTQLAAPYPISLPAISRHLKVLEGAGLITRDRQAQWRTNSLRTEPLEEATTWMRHLSHLWDDRFSRLEVHLAATKQALKTTEQQEPPRQPTRTRKQTMTDAPDISETYEVEISRYFDAAPEVVYQAFTDPEHLAQWFGPLMFSVPLDTVSVDLKPGGHWRMTMVSKDDPSWKSPVNATFTEVVENQLLVGYEVAEGIPGIADGSRLTLSIEFIAEGDGTRLELRQGPFPEQTREMSAVGWGQSFHKLDALLATPAKFRPGSEGATP